MNVNFKLFRKKVQGPPKAIVFVDYEHWYYSYQNLYGLKPDPIEWRKKLELTYQLEDVMVFADFSHKGIKDELSKLRSMTNTIIETQQTFRNYKKDMTDFIMLDYIYQISALRPDIPTVIIFTGDGHFQSVTKYLIQRLRKEVIVYGVKDAFSSHLKDVATSYIELPVAENILEAYYPMIVRNLSEVTERPTIIPTFLGTVAAVSRRNEAPETLVHAALSEMLKKGFVYQREQKVNFNRTIKVVAANWDKLEQAGLWSFK